VWSVKVEAMDREPEASSGRFAVSNEGLEASDDGLEASDERLEARGRRLEALHPAD
jgi:hypothetical protein